MTRRWRAIVSSALLLILSSTAGLEAFCLSVCVPKQIALHQADAPSCHQTDEGDRLAATGADPCATHDGRAAEPATVRDGTRGLWPPPAMLFAWSLPAGDAQVSRRPSAVTPGPAPPGPSRPPLVLRL